MADDPEPEEKEEEEPLELATPGAAESEGGGVGGLTPEQIAAVSKDIAAVTIYSQCRRCRSAAPRSRSGGCFNRTGGAGVRR